MRIIAPTRHSAKRASNANASVATLSEVGRLDFPLQ